MPRNLFDRELDELHNELTKMGHQVDVILCETIQVLKERDIDAARKIFLQDEEISLKERTIESKCMSIIALQQPLASDLRTITAVLKIVTDMERISDQCYDICEIVATIFSSGSSAPPAKIIKMFENAREMFADALSAFLSVDEMLAKRVCERDNHIDSLFSAVILELCNAMEGRQSAIPQSVDYMFIAKYIERIGDHAANLAEWAIFLKTGIHPDLNTSKNMV